MQACLIAALREDSTDPQAYTQAPFCGSAPLALSDKHNVIDCIFLTYLILPMMIWVATTFTRDFEHKQDGSFQENWW